MVRKIFIIDMNFNTYLMMGRVYLSASTITKLWVFSGSVGIFQSSNKTCSCFGHIFRAYISGIYTSASIKQKRGFSPVPCLQLNSSVIIFSTFEELFVIEHDGVRAWHRLRAPMETKNKYFSGLSSIKHQ